MLTKLILITYFKRFRFVYAYTYKSLQGLKTESIFCHRLSNIRLFVQYNLFIVLFYAPKRFLECYFSRLHPFVSW